MREIDAEVRETLVLMVRRVCPRWMADDLDDLVQMAAMRLLRSESDAELTPAYLSRVAYSAVIDEIRRRKRRNEIDATPSLIDRVADEVQPSPERLANASQLADTLLQCLELQVPARRQALALYLQGHTIPEIAELLDWDFKKAANAVYRGLPDLRVALADRGIRR